MEPTSAKEEIIYRCAGQWGLRNLDDFYFNHGSIVFTNKGTPIMSLTKDSYEALMSKILTREQDERLTEEKDRQYVMGEKEARAKKRAQLKLQIEKAEEQLAEVRKRIHQ